MIRLMGFAMLFLAAGIGFAAFNNLLMGIGIESGRLIFSVSIPAFAASIVWFIGWRIIESQKGGGSSSRRTK